MSLLDIAPYIKAIDAYILILVVFIFPNTLFLWIKLLFAKATDVSFLQEQVD